MSKLIKKIFFMIKHSKLKLTNYKDCKEKKIIICINKTKLYSIYSSLKFYIFLNFSKL
jgi:hypothetical protein